MFYSEFLLACTAIPVSISTLKTSKSSEIQIDTIEMIIGKAIFLGYSSCTLANPQFKSNLKIENVS